jgi:hypothetical protein
MRKFFLMLLIAGGILSIEGSPASAAPANGSAIASALKSNSLIQDVRLYCYNRYTGRFLHWGPCGGYRHYYHPYYRHYYHHYYHRRHWHRYYRYW